MKSTRFFSSYYFFVVVGALLLLPGCASTNKKRVEPSPPTQSTAPVPPAEQMGPPEPFGPNPAEVLGPNPDVVRSVVLVLGPGLAQGFADVGVLRALHENHVPVVAILGAETGALVGGLYANAQSINRFEFRLLHFKEDLFTQPTGLLSSFSGNRAEKYKSELSRAFEAKDLTDLKIPLWVAIRPAGSNAPMLVQKGNAVAAIAAATANPAVFPPVLWENSETRSAPHSLSALVQEARSLNRGVVVVVSVDGETPADSGDVFVSPNLAGIGPSDFSKMTEAAFRGKTATDEKIAQIKHLVGLE